MGSELVSYCYVYVSVGPCGCPSIQSVGVEESGGLWKETVAHSGCEGPNAAVGSVTMLVAFQTRRMV